MPQYLSNHILRTYPRHLCSNICLSETALNFSLHSTRLSQCHQHQHQASPMITISPTSIRGQAPSSASVARFQFRPFYTPSTLFPLIYMSGSHISTGPESEHPNALLSVRNSRAMDGSPPGTGVRMANGVPTGLLPLWLQSPQLRFSYVAFPHYTRSAPFRYHIPPLNSPG